MSSFQTAETILLYSMCNFTHCKRFVSLRHGGGKFHGIIKMVNFILNLFCSYAFATAIHTSWVSFLYHIQYISTLIIVLPIELKIYTNTKLFGTNLYFIFFI